MGKQNSAEIWETICTVTYIERSERNIIIKVSGCSEYNVRPIASEEWMNVFLRAYSGQSTAKKNRDSGMISLEARCISADKPLEVPTPVVFDLLKSAYTAKERVLIRVDNAFKNVLEAAVGKLEWPKQKS